MVDWSRDVSLGIIDPSLFLYSLLERQLPTFSNTHLSDVLHSLCHHREHRAARCPRMGRLADYHQRSDTKSACGSCYP
jgi:hypothetical protein